MSCSDRQAGTPTPAAYYLAGCAVVAAALLLTPAVGCGQRETTVVRRVAVPPFENLGADASLDWVGRAIAIIVRSQMLGAPDIMPLAADSPAMRPTHVLRGYYYPRDGRLRTRAFLMDAARGKTVAVYSEDAAQQGGVLRIAGAMARRLSDHSRPYGTGNEEALRHFVNAVNGAPAAIDTAGLERALGADPNFGDAVVALLQSRLRAGAVSAGALIEEVRSGRRRLVAIERAQVELLAANVANRLEAALEAREQLARLTPADSEAAAEVAEAYFRRRRFREALEWQERARTAEPGHAVFWNQLAYIQAYAGNLEAARKNLAQYVKLDPWSANPLDSLGEISFLGGRFAEAEKYFLGAYAKDPGFAHGVTLRKAAEARLMSGDRAGADEHFRRSLDAARLPAPEAERRRAQWEYVTGRRAGAIRRLEALAAQTRGPSDAAVYAWAQLAAWRLESGAAGPAREAARQAALAAASGPARRLASLVRFLAEPAAPSAELAVRAEKTFASADEATIKQFALGYTLVFASEFKEAALVWKAIVEGLHPGVSAHAEILLAWAYLESGRFADARTWLERHPLPGSGGEETFHSLVFPRGILLRARMLEKEGNKEQARGLFRLFLRYAGDPPTIFGDEKLARQALGSGG